MVTPFRQKPVPEEPRKTIFAKLSGTWLSCGNYGVYVALTGLCLAVLREDRLVGSNLTV